MLYMASALPDFHNEADLCDSAVESVRNFNFNGFTVICDEIFYHIFRANALHATAVVVVMICRILFS